MSFYWVRYTKLGRACLPYNFTIRLVISLPYFVHLKLIKLHTLLLIDMKLAISEASGYCVERSTTVTPSYELLIMSVRHM